MAVKAGLTHLSRTKQEKAPHHASFRIVVYTERCRAAYKAGMSGGESGTSGFVRGYLTLSLPLSLQSYGLHDEAIVIRFPTGFNVQTGSGDHPVSYNMRPGIKAAGDVKLTHLHLVPRNSTSTLPYVFILWCLIKLGKNLDFV
jgi:hypothetical protein